MSQILSWKMRITQQPNGLVCANGCKVGTSSDSSTSFLSFLSLHRTDLQEAEPSGGLAGLLPQTPRHPEEQCAGHVPVGQPVSSSATSLVLINMMMVMIMNIFVKCVEVDLSFDFFVTGKVKYRAHKCVYPQYDKSN